MSDYCTTEAVKALLGQDANDTENEARIEAAITAASRQIDDHCGKGRKFFQDAAVVNRSYWPIDRDHLFVDDISTTVGLVVKVDDDDDGTFETTLTISSDFIVEPVNAAAETPVRPYTRIRLLDGTLTGWQRLSSGRPYVQVTAKFGWPAIPDAIERACALQAINIYKSSDMFDAAIQLASVGAGLSMPTMNRQAVYLLAGYIRYDEVHDGG